MSWAFRAFSRASLNILESSEVPRRKSSASARASRSASLASSTALLNLKASCSRSSFFLARSLSTWIRSVASRRNRALSSLSTPRASSRNRSTSLLKSLSVAFRWASSRCRWSFLASRSSTEAAAALNLSTSTSSSLAASSADSARSFDSLSFADRSFSSEACSLRNRWTSTSSAARSAAATRSRPTSPSRVLRRCSFSTVSVMWRSLSAALDADASRNARACCLKLSTSLRNRSISTSASFFESSFSLIVAARASSRAAASVSAMRFCCRRSSRSWRNAFTSSASPNTPEDRLRLTSSLRSLSSSCDATRS
mmetsp:Transcript_16177/g.42631  ORF Transcript_16177/g.42631 Transcript_16177/m.42631 type:complete len:312 (+) Transcript_16177:865-1800(+)